ncbi:type I secretion system permease/ATPase [Sphingomonas sinipercae]|uniref:Type I secretion system permease/ATPase n=1 Tax=Sphingomonas sinipercae TaxID=2714944 RepID=A0A6G7ZQU5_9SPHN|nr:type I secretion system permease/ATPase [Sphingomonas sinipercae]
MQAALTACRRHFVYAFAFSALLNLLFIAPMLYMLQVYDRVLPTAGGTTLLFLTFAILFALSTLSALDSIRSRLLTRASVRLDKVLAGAIIDATLRRPDLNSQRLSRQALREFDILRQVLTGPAIIGAFDAPWIPIYILIAFIIHPWLGAMALVGAGLSIFLAWRNEEATRGPLQRANEAAGRAYASYESSLSAADTVRALGLREALVASHLAERGSMLSMQTDASLGSSRISALAKFLRLALQSLALGLGALLAIDAKITPGAVFAASFIVGRSLAPIDQLVGSWRFIVQARGALTTLRNLFAETPPDIALTRLPPPEGKLQVEALTVTDQHGRTILDDVSFNVAPATMVAIIGPSGAGKSTLVRAVAGASVPSSGVIRFDGADQKNWDPERLAEHVGYLPQDPSLFAGSIKENISRFLNRLGEDPTRLDEQAVAAARLAGAHDLILQLPGGYDYQLGMWGRGLSAGQAQRIALARALFRNPRYLILDEPNSNLDPEGDQQLIRTLGEIKAQGTTILVVAHRLSMLPSVDKIMLIQGGRLTAFGDRDEILRQMKPQPPARGSVVSNLKTVS